MSVRISRVAPLEPSDERACPLKRQIEFATRKNNRRPCRFRDAGLINEGCSWRPIVRQTKTVPSESRTCQISWQEGCRRLPQNSLGHAPQYGLQISGIVSTPDRIPTVGCEAKAFRESTALVVRDSPLLDGIPIRIDIGSFTKLKSKL